MPRLRAVLENLARSERGFTIPMTLMVIIAGLGLGGAAIMASVASQRGSVRDQASKTALAAADAGAEVALLRQNKVLTTDLLRCVGVVAGNLAAVTPNPDGWCPSETENVAGGATYTYRVKPWSLVGVVQNGLKRQLAIVSVGNFNGVSRRIETTASAVLGANVFNGNGAIGRDSISMNGNPKIVANAATNGDFTLIGNSLLCGNAQYGVGHTFSAGPNAGQCPGFSQTTGHLDLPNVYPGDTWTTNSNGRLFGQDPKTGNVTWNATTRTLTMTGNSTLTLGGTDYSFCRINMSGNSQLLIALGATVSIYFDAPSSDRCNLSGSQISMSGNSLIHTTSGIASSLRLLVVGSDSIATSVSITGNGSVNQFTLYAPRSAVTLSGNGSGTHYVGAFAGSSLSLNGNAQIDGDATALDVQVPIDLVYRREHYVECTGGAMTAPPDSSC